MPDATEIRPISAAEEHRIRAVRRQYDNAVQGQLPREGWAKVARDCRYISNRLAQANEHSRAWEFHRMAEDAGGRAKADAEARREDQLSDEQLR